MMHDSQEDNVLWRQHCHRAGACIARHAINYHDIARHAINYHDIVHHFLGTCMHSKITQNCMQSFADYDNAASI